MPLILVVEDNEMNQEVLSRNLEFEGFESKIASDGEIAVAMALELRPDLILMDLGLPVVDGWEATRRIKAQPETANIPIIAVTAHAMAHDRQKALDAGCDDYDSKPYDIDRLVGKMRTLLNVPAETEADNETAAPAVTKPAPGSSPSNVVDRTPADSSADENTDADRTERGRVLIVDDMAENRELIRRRVEDLGYAVDEAEGGREAIGHLEQKSVDQKSIDVVLLDIMMPEVDGFEVLRTIKSDTALRHIPVIIISNMHDDENVLRGIEMGADDFLPKHFDETLLKARLGACIDRKRLRDQEVVFRQRLEREKHRSDNLLHAIFPHSVVQELKSTNEYRPRRHQNVAVLFCDIVGFTWYCDRHPPEEVVEHLQNLVIAFENVSQQQSVQKIKTIGDAFLGVSGLFDFIENPVERCVRAGLGMIDAARSIPPHWDLRVGIHSGPVVAGIVGKQQHALDVWGSTVNIASRVQTASDPGGIAVSATAWQQIAHRARGSSRIIQARNIGDLEIIQFRGFSETE